MITLSVTEVIDRLTSNGVLCYATMLNGEHNQIVGQDNPKLPFSTWYTVTNGMVEVEDDFCELYPL